VNIAAVIDSGYKLLQEKHNNCSKFFGKLKLHLKEHD